ncbi:MAG: hypothetical protein ABI140_01460 [Jatrophihabitantaceae bacterium]
MQTANWRILSLPRCAIATVGLVDLLAALIPWASKARITHDQLGVALLLSSLSIAYSIGTVTFERVRVLLAKGTSPSMCPNLLATWTFAAAILLPLRLAALVCVIAAIADWPARNVARQTDPHKYVYSTAGAVIATAAANYLVATTQVPYPLGVLIAAIGYVVVGAGLIALVMFASGQGRNVAIFVKPETHRIELLTVSVGLTEVLLHSSHIPLIWLSLPAAIGIQHWSSRDALLKAGALPEPMGEAVWVHVSRGLVAGCGLSAVLRVDTDSPKALRELTLNIQSGCDALGQYGTGLAITLVDCPETHADALADRLRSALVEVCPGAKVAVAASPRDGATLDALLVSTEADLIVAAAGDPTRSRPQE